MTPQELFALHPFLGSLTADETLELLRHAHVRRLPAGRIVFRKDDPGDGLYGVLSGRIVVSVESVSGKELILNMFGPGEFFGEIALLDGKGRTATATAREPSVLLFLGRADFLPFLARRPEDSAFLGVPTRLAKQLVGLAGRYGGLDAASSVHTLRISQAELARTLGVSREIVSRQLAVWREAGILRLARGQVAVKDMRALQGIIAGG